MHNESVWEGRNLFEEVREPICLNYMLLVQSSISNWVFHMVKDIQKCVGMECEGFEEQFMALLTTIEAGHHQYRKGG